MLAAEIKVYLNLQEQISRFSHCLYSARLCGRLNILSPRIQILLTPRLIEYKKSRKNAKVQKWWLL